MNADLRAEITRSATALDGVLGATANNLSRQDCAAIGSARTILRLLLAGGLTPRDERGRFVKAAEPPPR